MHSIPVSLAVLAAAVQIAAAQGEQQGKSKNNTVTIAVVCSLVGFIVLKSACLFYVCYWRKRGARRSRIAAPTAHHKGYSGAGKADGSLQDWELDLSNVHICKTDDGEYHELGHGTFGHVYKGVRAEVQPVAIKMVVQADRQACESFVHEISILKFVSRDRNIVQFYGAGLRNSQLWLVTEFMEGGDLRVALSADPKYRVTWWNGGKPIAMDVARGLAFLHANNVIHRDLKSKNILLTQDGQAKIGDVGMSVVMSEGYLTNNNAAGTFAWAAPELLLNDRCTDKVDVYSLGVVIWEIATGEVPQRGNIHQPDMPQQCPLEVWQIVQDCIQRDPSKRPSPGDVFRRLSACAPNPRTTPILDSAHDRLGLAHIAENDKQLLQLIDTLDLSSGTGSHAKSKDTTVASSVRSSFSAPSQAQVRRSHTFSDSHSSDTLSSIAELPPQYTEMTAYKGPQKTDDLEAASPSPYRSPSFSEALMNTHGSFTDPDGNSQSTMGTDSYRAPNLSLSPHGDVVIEFDGEVPERLPVDGKALRAMLQQASAGPKPGRAKRSGV